MRTADSGIEKEDLKLYEIYWAKQFDKLEQVIIKESSSKDSRADAAYEHITDTHMVTQHREHT